MSRSELSSLFEDVVRELMLKSLDGMSFSTPRLTVSEYETDSSS